MISITLEVPHGGLFGIKRQETAGTSEYLCPNLKGNRSRSYNIELNGDDIFGP